MASRKQIITIGGGKGGVGKSIIAVNLSTGLAMAGKKVVLIDTDVGASNIHAMVGISNPTSGFHEFFSRDEADPQSFLLDTSIENLRILSIAGDIPGTSSLGPFFHHKILTLIVHAKADYIVLDLGPGAEHNTSDFFILGDKKVVVTTPEITSIMNTFSFIKAALFRKISKVFDTKPYLHALIDYSVNPNPTDEVNEVNQLMAKLKTIDPPAIHDVREITENFAPCLIVNRVRKKKDLQMANHLVKLTKKFLNLDLNKSGFMVENEKIRNSVDEMVPFFLKEPQSKPSEILSKIILNITGTDPSLINKDDGSLTSQSQP